MSAQRGNLFLQRRLLGRFGVCDFLFGTDAGVFHSLQLGRLLGRLLGHTVFFLLNARGPDLGYFTHPRAPRQIFQLPQHGVGLRDVLHFALDACGVKTFAAGGHAAHGAGMAQGVLAAPGFGLGHKLIALRKCALDFGVFGADLGVGEIKPIGPNLLMRKRGTHALGFTWRRAV